MAKRAETDRFRVYTEGVIERFVAWLRGSVPSLARNARGRAFQVLTPGPSPASSKAAPVSETCPNFHCTKVTGELSCSDNELRQSILSDFKFVTVSETLEPGWRSIPALARNARGRAFQVLTQGHSAAERRDVMARATFPFEASHGGLGGSQRGESEPSKPSVSLRDLCGEANDDTATHRGRADRREASIQQVVAWVAGPARGVAMVQFAIVFPLLVIFIFGIVDFARFFTLQSIVSKGAEDGARAAATMSNLDVDLRGLTTADEDYINFVEGRRRVLEAAQVYPLQTLATDIDTPSSSKLVPFYTTDSALSLGAGQSAPVVRAGAALIRPGEQVEFGESQPGEVVANQLYPPGPGGSLPPQDMAMLMKEFPVEVHVRATLDLIIPIGTVTVRGSSIAWHGRVPRGPFGNVMGSTTTTTTTSTTSSTTTSTSTTSTTTTTLCVMNWTNAIWATQGGGNLGRCPDVNGPPDGLGHCPNGFNACTMDGL